MGTELYPKITIRIFGEDKYFGPGVAALLRGVRQHHSLRAAAQSMDMAYSKAWKIIRQAENGLGLKLLTSTTGGKGGGGAVLTSEGEQLLTAYTEYCQAVKSYGETLFQEKFSFLNHE